MGTSKLEGSSVSALRVCIRQNSSESPPCICMNSDAEHGAAEGRCCPGPEPRWAEGGFLCVDAVLEVPESAVEVKPLPCGQDQPRPICGCEEPHRGLADGISAVQGFPRVQSEGF